MGLAKSYTFVSEAEQKFFLLTNPSCLKIKDANGTKNKVKGNFYKGEMSLLERCPLFKR